MKGPYSVIPSALILVRRNPTSKIWEGMGDGHHQSPLGWGGWVLGGVGEISLAVLLSWGLPLHLFWILAASF